MPPIGWHMATARDALHRTGCTQVDPELGCFLLGATAPDMRVMTGQPREETHFFTFENDHEQSGAAALFNRYPGVMALRGRAQAFVAGYLTHLTVDESWIQEVYRPFFGKRSPLAGGLEANFMDRVLQFYMEQGERPGSELLQRWFEYVFRADPGDEVPFVDLPSLHRWREVVVRIVTPDPTWERFSAFIQRRFGAAERADEQTLREYCERIPEVLERTLRHVTPERIAAYREAAVERSAQTIREYLA